MNNKVLNHFLWAALLFVVAATTAYAQVRGEFLITNYGAKGDGAFDNAPVINSLLDQMPNTGGSLVIPHGDFRINSPIILRKSYVTIRGMGRGSKLIVGTGVHEGIVVPNESPRISGVTLRDFHVTGGDGGAGQTGILFDRANDGMVMNGLACTELRTGIFVRDADAGRINSCSITRCENALHLLGGTVTAVGKNHFSAFSGGTTVHFEALNRVQFAGNVIMPDGAVGLWLHASDSCNISGNIITSWYTGCIEVEGNMNSFSGNNITAVKVNDVWVPDPRGRDGLWGLIRIRGNDNAFTSSSIISWQPENDIRVNVINGGSTTLRDLTIGGIGSIRKINVDPAATWTRITHCGWPQETQLNGNPTARVVYDP